MNGARRARGPVAVGAAALVALVYAAVVLVALSRHEAWADEVDAWLVARDATLSTLFGMTSHMGTPALWYLVLKVPALAGAPLATMGVLNALFCAGAVAILLLAAPLPRVTKLAFTFGFYALYEYGVIARPYGLLMLLLFGAAATYPHRLRRPILYGALLALLANTAIHGAIMAAGLGALFLIDAWLVTQGSQSRSTDGSTAPGGRVWAGVGVALLGGLAVLWQLWPRSDAQIPSWFEVQNPEVWESVASHLFFHPAHARLALSEASRLLVPFLAPLLVAALLDRPRALAFLVWSLAAFGYVFLTKWYQAPRHAGLVLMAVIVGLWVARHERSAVRSERLARLASLARCGAIAFVTIGLLVSVVQAVAWVRIDWSEPFSNAREVAAWVRANSPSGETLAGDAFAPAVLAHLPPDRKLWIGHRRQFGSHGLWTGTDGRQILETTLQDIIRDAETDLPRPRPLLLVLSHPLFDPAEYGYVLVYQTRRTAFGYYYQNLHYYLYRRVPTGSTAAASEAVPVALRSPEPSSDSDERSASSAPVGPK